jgi:succinyl-diaminopimelate desuccinylase
MTEVEEILNDLIEAPSPNPPGDCEAVAAVCLRWLDDLGIPRRVVRAPDGTPSVIVSIGTGPRRLLVHSHYDTQPPGELSGWTSPPYEAAHRDGKIFGRGAGDDKGSVAAQIAALRQLHRHGFDPGHEVRFAFVADEESGGERGTRFLLETGELECDAALFGEQTANRLAIGERGIVWVRVVFAGRSAHGAIPGAGLSACVPAARLVTLVEDELVGALESRRPTSLLQASSVTVGRFVSGIDVSIVPERAVVELDRRIVPGETVTGCVDEIRVLAERVAAGTPGLTVEVGSFLEAEAFLTPPEDPFVRSCQQILTTSGLAPDVTGYRQASDARYLGGRRIPIVIFGPSDPEVGHAPDEHVPVQELVDAARVIEQIALSATFG